MTTELWVIIAIAPVLSYFIARWGVYGYLCGKARYRRKHPKEDE